MITVTCHCGNVSLTFDRLPATVRDCDCPICNRLGALWADFLAKEVAVVTTSSTGTYRWGDQQYEMHHCKECGCTTHYTGTQENEELELGINLRMLDRRRLETISIQS